MLVCMKRTTLVLEDELLQAVRETAHRRGTDMSRIANEWLSLGFQHEREQQTSAVRPLPVHRMGVPRVNLADRDQLQNLMDES